MFHHPVSLQETSNKSAVEISDELTVNQLYKIILSAKETNDTLTQAKAYLQIAKNDLISVENSDRVIRSYQTAIDLFGRVKDSTMHFSIKTDLARFLAEQKFYQEALARLRDAMGYYQSKEDSSKLGVIYYDIANVYLAAGNINMAVVFLNKSHEINLVLRDTFLATVNLMILHSISDDDDVEMPVSDSAFQALIDFEGHSQKGFRATAMLNVAMYYMDQERFRLALHYLERAKSLASKNATTLRKIYKELARYHELVGDHSDAYFYLNKYSVINDSINDVKLQDNINRYLISRQKAEEYSAIRELEKNKYIASVSNRAQRIISFSLLIGSIIILFGTYITIRLYQQRLNTNQIIGKQKEELTQSRIAELESNLKLETMHSMLQGQEAERERISKDLHDSLGGLLSTVKLHFDAASSKTPSIEELPEYQKAYGLLDEACKEVRNISNNMQPGALLKLGIVAAINDLINRIQSDKTPQMEFQHYGVDGGLDQTSTLNIYRIVQELLVNALKHAEAEEILIQLIQKDNELIIMVEDDGSGYDEANVKKGMGSGNIASRVKFLKGELSIDSEIGKGTTTLVTIPVEV